MVERSITVLAASVAQYINSLKRHMLLSEYRRASETDGKAKQKRLSRALLDLENYKALLEEAKATVSTANMVPRAELDKSVAGAVLSHLCHSTIEAFLMVKAEPQKVF